MDVTLDDQYRIPTDITCADPQGQPPSNSSTSSGSPSSTQGTASPTSTGSTSSGGGVITTAVDGLLGLGLAGVLAIVLA